MALPINIEDLIHGKSIEWERLEFKRNWNPEEVAHSLCAFANDINNWGGGYIVIGIAEEKGKAIIPPEGLDLGSLDDMQGEVLKLSHQLQPNYFPIMQPYVLEEKHILVIWCPAGDNRPYTTLSTQGKNSQRQPYVRIGSRSIIAKGENLRRLQELTARIPFDDRIHGRAEIADLDLSLIQAYLYEVKSELYEESKHISFDELCQALLIAKGPIENLRPVNVGLLFFSKQPEKFFSRAWIELVWYKDEKGSEFEEYYFKGPLHQQLRDSLSFLQSHIIGEKTIKYNDRAKADRFYNFPFEAIEEVLSNAVYHKSYEVGSPIEVQVWPDKILILSHPGPIPPVNSKVLNTQKRVFAREYRNRRIGDFLKELKLTEGRGSGLPSIYNAMETNGSPTPLFETDEETYVLVMLPVHQAFVKKSNHTVKVPLEGDPFGNYYKDANEGGLMKELRVEFGSVSDRILVDSNENILFLQQNFGLFANELRTNFGRTSDELRTNFGEKTILLLMLISIDSTITAKNAGLILGVSSRTIESYLSKLQKENIIQRIGSDKNGYWQIINKNK